MVLTHVDLIEALNYNNLERGEQQNEDTSAMTDDVCDILCEFCVSFCSFF